MGHHATLQTTEGRYWKILIGRSCDHLLKSADVFVPATKTKMDDQAFCVLGPHAQALFLRLLRKPNAFTFKKNS